MWCLSPEVVEKATQPEVTQIEIIGIVRDGKMVKCMGVIDPKGRITSFREGGEFELM